MKHFLKETDFSTAELGELLTLARRYKHKNASSAHSNVLAGQTWAMLFFKSSTRTRVSFEVGLNDLGGHALYLAQSTSQLSRGESIADTAQTLSRYVKGLIIRTFDHNDVEEFARAGSIPVINALTDFLHPCQSFSDLLTMAEQWNLQSDDDLLESLKGRKIAFLGDCNCNVANSLILAARMGQMQISLGGPREYAPTEKIEALLTADGYNPNHQFTTDPLEAVKDADAVYTDVWVSMGDEAEETERLAKMKPYSVTAELMQAAQPGAVFMHCLPAHPGMEVSQEVLAGPQSIVFDQAENRLHMQKAIMSCLAGEAAPDNSQ